MIQNSIKFISLVSRSRCVQNRSFVKALTSVSRNWFGRGGCCGGKPDCNNNQQRQPIQHNDERKQSSYNNHLHDHGKKVGDSHHQGQHIAAHNDNKNIDTQHKHQHGPNCNHDHQHQTTKEHVHGPDCNHEHDHYHNNEQVQIPKECLAVDKEVHQVGLTEIESSYTRGSVSILDNIKGAKNHDRGELYVLMFTCTKCDTRSIRSFTKVAYHEGVVLIKCEGCQNVHLIADNLGWFEDEPTNLQDFKKVDKVVDPVAVTKILKYVFDKHEQDKPTLQKSPEADKK